MAPDPERPAADDDTLVVGRAEPDAPEESRRAHGEDWPVADQYYVEPASGAPTATTPANATRDAIVLTQTPSAPPRRKFPPDPGPGLLLVLLAVVAALVLGAIFLARDDEPTESAQTPPEAQPTMPTTETTTTTPTSNERLAVADVEGMTLREAEAALEKQGLRVRVRVRRTPSERPRGEVLSQLPAAEAEVAKGAVVALVVSSGTAPTQPQSRVEVPELVGRSASSALAAVRDAGLEARVRIVTSSERPGSVVGQSPAAGTVVDEGTTIELEVARARPEVPRIEVPDVVGSTAADARSQLRSLGLTVATVTVVSQEPAGTVIDQSPRPGVGLRKGGKVRLTVSAGPAKVDVPDVTGLDEWAARLELERAGFQVQVLEESTPDPAQDGVVLRQSPEGGSSAREGALVTITVGRFD